MEYIINYNMINAFKAKLIEDEKSNATLKKYIRDVEAFFRYVGTDTAITKDIVIQYKQYLMQHYAITSVNSMLAAINQFFKEMGWFDCIVKALKMQRKVFRSKEKELSKKEYLQLLETAQKRGNQRLYLLMETVCSTGIRISELPFITVESLAAGQAMISLKGKTRIIILPTALRRELKSYLKETGIKTGSIFVTRSGKPMDRSNILHAMKSLCEDARVDSSKVFPHNLRHLFACTYYKAEKDLSHLADILGHSNINTTRIYTMVSGEEQAKQIDRLALVVQRTGDPIKITA